MAGPGRPPGSPNVRNEKPFGDALRAALAADDYKALRRIATRLIGMAEAGDLQAISMIGDRLDGKVRQSTDVTLRTAAARELSDDDLAAIAVGADVEDQEIPQPDLPKLN
jgi:HPt (histidine-containing phosphotransfer) domain-containing protein